ncbi:Caudovirus, tape measure, N-terminal [uncultured Caudovirales phage]|uniref:Caudovirus, tape measure, N-terminal n=1 Tax=uncultured Caudovirales phage TaxID=2100421 RepID=A0A6J5L062_9CAUD|nr:Caudovirus, tape measure, N-terminal [uncultured Caudovirales phage]
MSQNREEYIISLIDRGVSSGLKDISSSVDSVRVKMDGLQNNVGTKSKGLLGSLGGLTSMLGGLGAIAGIGYLGKQVVSLGANMEQTKVAFATFMGDTEKANILIGQLNEFANITPFNNEEVIKSGRSLLSAGLSADKVTETLGMLGDIASGVSMPLEDLGQIYSKSMSKGKLQAEELNQLSERGVPLMQELARMTGKNKGELYKMAEQGAITSDVLQQAFKNMTSEGGMYFGLMDKQSQTTAGKWSTFVGQLQTLGIKLGEMLLPVLSKFADFGIMLTNNKGLLKDIAIVVGILTGAFIVYKTAMLVSTIATGGMSTAMASLNAIMYANPIGLIIVAIASLVTGVVLAIRHFESWGATLLWFFGPIGRLISLFKMVYDNWGRIKKAFSGGGIDGMIKGLKILGGLIIDVFLKPLEQIGGFFDKLFGTDVAKNIRSVRESLGIVEKEKPKKTTDVLNTYYSGEKKDSTNGMLGDIIKGVSNVTKKTETRTKDGTYIIPTLPKPKLKPKGTSNLKSGLSEITASAPKTFNIHIGALVKEQKFETVKDLSEIKTIVKNELSRLLLGVTNDIQTT